ncbi:MAG: ParB/RepB/Spo0J family partition protein [Patescibacteria group bacterium]
MSQNYGLGRGLSSLIPQKKKTAGSETNYFGAPSREVSGVSSEPSKNQVQEVEIFRVVPNPHQPRITFEEVKLRELSDSIKEHGIIQPLVVSQKGNQFELIAGERRLQASKLAGLKTVPIIIREVNDQEKLELAIIENIQRHDLNPIEEGQSYLKLMEEFGMSQEEVAVKVGKSRSAVANKIRLLTLPSEIKKALVEGRITEGHAKAILAIENPEKQRALFEMILKGNLTVRQTEEKTQEISVKAHKRISNKDPKIAEIENQLTGKLGTKVKISSGKKGGRILIEYYSQEELENLLSKIN